MVEKKRKEGGKDIFRDLALKQDQNHLQKVFKIWLSCHQFWFWFFNKLWTDLYSSLLHKFNL